MRGLALFEAVSLPALVGVGDVETYAAARAVFDDYLARVDRGVPDAARVMADFWFGAGAFDRFPEAVRAYIVKETARNARDVRATFAFPCSREDLQKLDVPVLAVYGGNSPEVTGRIARAIATHAPQGRLVALDGADHALTTTHPAAVADLIAAHADRCAAEGAA
jgi:pimeloyl-ACP methyl ester carboxylesterase